MKRPVTVIVGVVVLAIQAGLTIVLALNLLQVLGQYPAGTEGLATSQLLSALVLVIGLVTAGALVFVARGYGLARLVIVVVGGIQVAIDVASSQLTIGDLLWAIAVVLLFVPISNAWFRAKARERAERT
jgi:hypothetical protein